MQNGLGEQENRLPIQQIKEYEGPPGPVTSSTIGGGEILEKAKLLLRLKGCTIEEGETDTSGNKTQIIYFPEGTVKSEIFPANQISRYIICFRNGFELLEYPVIGKNYNVLQIFREQDKLFLREYRRD